MTVRRASWPRLAAVALAASVILAAARPAAAEGEPSRVIVWGAGPAFEHAASVALSPWLVQVSEIDASPPPADAFAQAADRCRAHGARALVWFGRGGGGVALYVYDAQTERLLSRVVPQGPPFDEVSAAAGALSLKTLLRASAVAPEGEREAPPPAAAPSPSPPAAAAPPPDAPPARAPSPPARRLEVALEAGARTLGDAAEPRVGSAVRAFWGEADGPGVEIAGRVGRGRAVETAALAGRLHAGAVAASLRYRAGVGGAVVEPSLGATLHVASLTGVTDRGVEVGSGRVDASVDAGAMFGLRLAPRVTAGLEAQGSYLTRYPRYLVGGAPVLELSPVQGAVWLKLLVGVL